MVLTLHGYIRAYGRGRLLARRDSTVTLNRYASRDFGASDGANRRMLNKRDVVVARVGAVQRRRTVPTIDFRFSIFNWANRN